jgi:HD-like signal output (HDOD) protein
MAMPRRLQDWVSALDEAALPILPFSAHVLGRLSEEAEPPGINELCGILYRDPALVHHILRRANGLRHRHLDARVNSLEQAVMMLGIERVMRLPATMPSLEQSLEEPNRSGYLEAASGAYHAACQAWSWAKLRHDMLPSEVFTATLLRHSGELALWAHGAETMPQIAELQAYSDGYRDEAEYVQLGFTSTELSLALVQLWRLPTLVTENLRPEKTLTTRAFGIVLAVRLSALSRHGWHHPEMIKILRAVAAYVNTDETEAARIIHEAAEQAMRETHFLPAHPYQALLGPALRLEPRHEPEARTYFCQVPQADLFARTLQELSGGDFRRVHDELAAKHEHIWEHDPPIALALRAMHTGLGLSRALFARMRSSDDELEGYMLRGTESDPLFNRFRLGLRNDNLVRQMMHQPEALWVNATNSEELLPRLPREFRRLIGVNSFFLASVFVGGKPFGLFYADRHLPGCELDARSFAGFREVCRQVAVQLERL